MKTITARSDIEGDTYYVVEVTTGELSSTGETRTFWGACRLVRRFTRLHKKGIEVKS